MSSVTTPDGEVLVKPPGCTCAYPTLIARNMCGHTPPCPVYEAWAEKNLKTKAAPKASAAEGRLWTMNRPTYAALDPGIRRAVEVLYEAGIESYESCEGGPGHAYPEPTVRFHGVASQGFIALAVALQHGLPVSELRRVYSILEGEPVGPTWELTFRPVTT